MERRNFVSTAWLAERLDAPDIVIVDGSYYLPAMQRDAEAEFLAGHIPGAIRFDIDTVKDPSSPLPHMLPRPEAFASAMREMGIGDGMTIVAYDGAGLFSAARVWWTFRSFGVRDVVVLEGGFPAWKAEGRPTEEGPARPRQRRHFTARFDHSAVADLADMRRYSETGAAQIVDARAGDRFRGEVPEPRAGLASGHIPGSRNLPFNRIVENGRLADDATVAAAFAEAGIDPQQPLVTSCGSGVTAAVLSLALDTIGRPAKALYDGSWSEWGGRDDCPVETGPARDLARQA